MYTNRAHCRALRLMFALRKEQAYFINLNGICLRLRPKGVQGASGKPPASGMIRQLCRNQFPVGGRVGFDIPWVSRQLRCPKVSKGRAESPLVRPQAHPPCRGIDAPTPAREWDLPSHGALTLFFRWRKKSMQKKASGTATTGKRLLLPILPAGLAMSRAMELDSFHILLERARARLFPPSKWAGLFPFAAYRRSAPSQLALGRLKWR